MGSNLETARHPGIGGVVPPSIPSEASERTLNGTRLDQGVAAEASVPLTLPNRTVASVRFQEGSAVLMGMNSFKVWSSCGLGQSEVTVDPHVCLIVSVAKRWFVVAVSPPGLETGVCFAKTDSTFPAVPKSLRHDEDAGEYRVVEWLWRDAAEGQVLRTF